MQREKHDTKSARHMRTSSDSQDFKRDAIYKIVLMSECLGIRATLPKPDINAATGNNPTVVLARKKSSVESGSYKRSQRKGAEGNKMPQNLSPLDIQLSSGTQTAQQDAARKEAGKASPTVSHTQGRQCSSPVEQPDSKTPRHKDDAPSESTLTYDYHQVKKLKTLRQKQQHCSRIV
jgi:hypothetical protein